MRFFFSNFVSSIFLLVRDTALCEKIKFSTHTEPSITNASVCSVYMQKNTYHYQNEKKKEIV